jgi:hypothetical protein
MLSKSNSEWAVAILTLRSKWLVRVMFTEPCNITRQQIAACIRVTSWHFVDSMGSWLPKFSLRDPVAGREPF